MNTITNNTIRIGSIALAAFVLLVLAVAIAPKAYAADMSILGDSGSWITDSATPFYDFTSSPSDSGSWITDSATPYYDYSNPSNYGGYSSPSSYGGYSSPSSYSSGCGYYCGSGYSSSGYSSGSSGYGYGGSSSTYAPSTVTDNGNTSIYAPTQTNTCMGGNTCNSTVDDHSVFNAPTTVTITNPAQQQQQQQQQIAYQPVYQQPTYQPCNTCNCNGNCYTQPITYQQPTRQPYVSLTAVPYTGLDLGPVGTTLYWSFLVVWCLLAAYLVVVKRIQNKIVKGLNHFLFGVTHAAPVKSGARAHAVHTSVAHTAVAHEDAIDPFIASQIARAR